MKTVLEIGAHSFLVEDAVQAGMVLQILSKCVSLEVKWNSGGRYTQDERMPGITVTLVDDSQVKLQGIEKGGKAAPEVDQPKEAGQS